MGKDDLYRIVRAGLHVGLVQKVRSFQGLGEAFIRLAVRSRTDNMRLVFLVEKWLKGK